MRWIEIRGSAVLAISLFVFPCLLPGSVMSFGTPIGCSTQMDFQGFEACQIEQSAKKYMPKPCSEPKSLLAKGNIRRSGSWVAPDRPDGDGGDDQGCRQTKLSPATVVLRAAWGREPGQLGRSIFEEANPEAPMSFAVSENGSIYILDQLNQRVQVFDATGVQTATIPISRSNFTDIDLGLSGQVVLLDQWREQAVIFIDTTGRQVGSVPLLDGDIPDAGGVSGHYSRGDGVWVGYEDKLVRVCDADGKADPDRPAVSGRFSRDGKYLLQAHKLGDITASLTRKPVGTAEVESFGVTFDIPILYFTLIETDAGGKMYLGVNLLEEGGEPPCRGLEQCREEVVIFSSAGTELRRLIVPVSTHYEEVTRSLRVAADGTVYQLVIGESGATVRRYDP